MRPLVLVTGFGPFEDVEENPSGLLARRLASEPPEGLDLVAEVLPVSFARGPARLLELVEALPRRPDLLLGLGLHPEAGYRAELRARAELSKPGRGDVDGIAALEAETPPGPDLWTTLDAAVRGFVAGRAAWRLSEEAGGYVCERLYRVQLEVGLRLGCAALFVHVPRLDRVRPEEQLAELRALVAALVRP